MSQACEIVLYAGDGCFISAGMSLTHNACEFVGTHLKFGTFNLSL